tara:strand:+ start:442 stop:717 length:276 start_codon:yes stop_codon:yes gene_type:complete
MPRPKKITTPAALKPKKEQTYTLTKEQFESLKTISELISEARSSLYKFDAENLAVAGFIAGQVYVAVDRAETTVDDIINSFDEDSWGDLDI